MQIKLSFLQFFLSLLIIQGSINVKADEGMWLPFKLSQQNYQKMQALGLNIPMEQIFNTSAPSLKDAVVSLNNGSCTGSFISNQGLLITNHHCVLSDVQWHSSISNNYLDDGFWAADYSAELPIPGKTASILIDVIDVTEKILNVLPDGISEQYRTYLIDSISNELVNQYQLKTSYTAEISHFYQGNQFILFLTEVFEDVRLVASPPSSIGQFGKDEDNWMWPRHSADFALLRVYSTPDGKPAPYNDKNVPYQPKKFLNISLKGVEKDNFTMVMGFPGSTQRFLSSYGIQELEQVVNPVIKEVRGIKQSIWETDMQRNATIKIQYASKFAESSNYWKYAIGQNLSIRSRNMIENRRELESRFTNWLSQNPEKAEKYGHILPSLAMIHTFKSSLVKTGVITMETMISGPDLFLLALEALYFKSQLEEIQEQPEILKQAQEEFRQSINNIHKDFNSNLDQKVFAALLDYYRKNIADSLRAPDNELFDLKDKLNSNALANRIYAQSVLTNPKRFEQFMANPDADKLQNDPALLFVSTVMNHFAKSFFMMEEIDAQTDGLMRQYIMALKDMNPDQEFYPDANSSMRLSFGTVQPYSPRDGVKYNYYTTTRGLLQKMRTSPQVYQIPADFEKMLIKGDFGAYANSAGQMPVCFVSNNDITGGNSGSPVLNGDGELIGLAFDGNWEGMGSDLEYMDGLQMCVNVDIRYVLFILDKYAGLQRILDEMSISKIER